MPDVRCASAPGPCGSAERSSTPALHSPRHRRGHRLPRLRSQLPLPYRPRSLNARPGKSNTQTVPAASSPLAFTPLTRVTISPAGRGPFISGYSPRPSRHALARSTTRVAAMPMVAASRSTACVRACPFVSPRAPAPFVAARPSPFFTLTPTSLAHLTPACSGLASLAADAYVRQAYAPASW